MPKSMVRLSAGRESMSEATQALCFMAGANSIFTGDKLLTTGNRGDNADAALFAKLGLRPMESEEPMRMEAAERPLSPASLGLPSSGLPGGALPLLRFWLVHSPVGRTWFVWGKSMPGR